MFCKKNLKNNYKCKKIIKIISYIGPNGNRNLDHLIQEIDDYTRIIYDWFIDLLTCSMPILPIYWIVINEITGLFKNNKTFLLTTYGLLIDGRYNWKKCNASDNEIIAWATQRSRNLYAGKGSFLWQPQCHTSVTRLQERFFTSI